LAGQTHFTIDGLIGLYPLIIFAHDAWTGVVAPAGTPADVLNTLNRAINEGLQSAQMQENLVRFSAVAQPGTPQDFAAFMQSELLKWAQLVTISGASAE
jgi:tripartite-type tricarboxylate transporter receptor subunit TctC